MKISISPIFLEYHIDIVSVFKKKLYRPIPTLRYTAMLFSVTSTLLKKNFYSVRTSVKVLIGASAVYVTFAEGVWSNSIEGSQAAQRLRNLILPESSQYWSKVSSELIGYKEI